MRPIRLSFCTPFVTRLLPGLPAVFAARPDRKALVLCGHTHGAATVDVLPNLQVETGGAKYGSPTVRFMKLS